MHSMVARPTYCPMVAALAAPTTPHPATKTKKRSRLRFTAFAAALAISGVLHHDTAPGLMGAAVAILHTKDLLKFGIYKTLVEHYIKKG